MRILGFFARLIGGILLAILVAGLFGFLVQWLWNTLMPVLFHLPQVSFWQAAGLVLLSRILFGHIGGGHHHGRHRKCRCRGGNCCSSGDAGGGHDHPCCTDKGWGRLGKNTFFKRWSPNGDPSELEHFDDWWNDVGESSFESSAHARRGGWGWWSWWKKEGKTSYEEWLARRSAQG